MLIYHASLRSPTNDMRFKVRPAHPDHSSNVCALGGFAPTPQSLLLLVISFPHSTIHMMDVYINPPPSLLTSLSTPTFTITTLIPFALMMLYILVLRNMQIKERSGFMLSHPLAISTFLFLFLFLLHIRYSFLIG